MRIELGAFAVLCYVALTATQGIALGSLVQRNVWDPIVLMVATFSIVALFFNVSQLSHRADYFRLVRESKWEVAWLNLLTAANFLSYYWAIRTVPISSHATIALGLGPVVVLLAGGENISRGKVLSVIGISLSLVAIALQLVGKASTVDLLMSFVCGMSLVFTLFSQIRLKEIGFSAAQIMASRFFLLIIVGLVMSPTIPAPSADVSVAVLQVSLLAVFGTIVPLYLLTWGQCHTRPLVSTLLLYAMPLLMVVGEIVEARIAVSPSIVGGVLATCVFLAAGYLAK